MGWTTVGVLHLSTVMLAITALVAGCGGPADGEGGQWYRAVLEPESDASIPFFLWVPADCVGDAAAVINGEERIAVACHRDGSELDLDFPVYDTRIQVREESGGRLSGLWVRRRQGVVVASVEAHPVAEPAPEARFEMDRSGERTVERPSVAGVWRVELASRGPGKGTFSQSPSGVVRGSIELVSTYGDVRFLAGNLAGTELRLSSFDGQYAHVLTADVAPDGSRMEGEMSFRGEGRETFVAERTGDFELADPLDRVRVTSPDGRVGLDVLADQVYDGKAVIVEIFGTWCPNCHDVTPVLVELYERYQAQGLDVVSVAYEAGGDRGYNLQRVSAYREKYRVPWDTVLAEETSEELASEGIAGLSPIAGVPVTLFLNRDGTVHAVYTGFAGPATGASYERATSTFRRLTNEILAGG